MRERLRGQISQEDHEKKRAFEAIGKPAKFSWFFTDFFGNEQNRLRYVSGAGGAVGALAAAGPGVITCYGPTNTGVSLVDTFNSQYSPIRSVRGKWCIGMLARTPTAFSAVSNAGLFVNTATPSYVSVGVFGAISQTVWRVGRGTGASFNVTGLNAASTKTVADTTGAAGTYFSVVLLSDGTNFKASVDNEPLITLGPVTSVADGACVFGVRSDPSGVSTSDGFHVDALWCGQEP